MDIDTTLKLIRTQIKYGRVVEAEKALEFLSREFLNTERESEILEIHASSFLQKLENYKKAIPVLRRLLDLKISDDLRIRATDFLNKSIKKEIIVRSEPNLNPDFLKFMETIRSKKIFENQLVFFDFSPYFLVKDLEESKKTAWHQSIKAPFQSWNMLRTNASKEIHNYYFENKINMILCTMNWQLRLGKSVKKIYLPP